MGHRFRQVLIDDEVVWDADVADSDSYETWPYSLNGEGRAYCDYHVVLDISEKIRPGQTVTLALRIVDKVASDVSLDGDVHVPNVFEQPDVDRGVFETTFDFRAWFGDVRLCADRTAAECEQGTWMRRFAAILPDDAPRGVRAVRTADDPTEAVSVPLTIMHADLLPEGVSYPLTGGIPMPPKLLRDAGQIRLTDAAGNEVPCQVEIKSTWPGDDSAQWVWIHTTVTRGMKELTMHCGGSSAAPRTVTALTLVRDGDGICIDTGKVSIEIPAGAGDCLIRSMQVNGQAPCGPVRGVLSEQRLGDVRRFAAMVQDVSIEQAGPIKATVAINGQLRDEDGNVFGKFTARVSLWRDSELIGLTYRVFQQNEQTVSMVWEMALEIDGPWGLDARSSFSADVPELADVVMCPVPDARAEIRQNTADHCELRNGLLGPLGSVDRAEGWVALRDETDGGAVHLAGGVRWFWQQWPQEYQGHTRQAYAGAVCHAKTKRLAGR